MEDEEEVIPSPNLRGVLELTNRAWASLDPQLWTMAQTLIVLDISYNKIVAIPPEIGKLQMLRELKASFNQIATLPPEIGKLKRLKRLLLNTNKLVTLPKEIGKLDMLEEFVLSENVLEEIPPNLSTMTMLRILRLQNNNLRMLPYELADISTLEELNVEGNNKLEMVPKAWQGNSESVLFICRIHRSYYFRMEELSTSNEDLMKHSQFLEQEQLQLKEEINRVQAYTDQLKRLVPKKKLLKFEQSAKVDSEIRDASSTPSGKDGDKKGGSCTIM